MSEPKAVDRKKLDRRAFLKGIGLSAGAAGVTALTMGAPVEAKSAPVSGKPSIGYRESEHVLRIYDLAKRY
jgi:hypothetical protein